MHSAQRHPGSWWISVFCMASILSCCAQAGAQTPSLSASATSASSSASHPSADKGAPAPNAVAPAAFAADPPSASSISPVQSTIEVNAGDQTLQTGLAVPYHVTQSEVLSSAGTWGDFTRYLQVLPGVVWNSDMSNDVMVRGGHPSENLYVVDGIEVPNINHLSLEGTTGGFTSMIDTSSIGSVDMKAGVYDARFSSRLSSLIDIRTREDQGVEQNAEAEFGIAGVGGFFEHQLAGKGNLLLSAHRSILNLITNNIGLNGVPIYTNGLARLDWSPSQKDHVSALSLSGADSMDIAPAPCDALVSLPFRTEYDGARSTDGLVWQHVHSPAVVSQWTASWSFQGQNVGQQQQTVSFDALGHCTQYAPANVYTERTRDTTSNLGYGLQMQRSGWLLSMGATGRLAAMNYNVVQPLGQQSAFNPSPAWTDADNFNRQLAKGQSAAYFEATGHPAPRWTVIAGAREETFALTGSQMFEPRASVAFRLNEHQAINAGFGRSAQLAPAINILSYPQNAHLRPIEADQFSIGADLWHVPWAAVSMEAYSKRYSNEPVSTEYPSLMLSNMVDTLGEQFIWLPLKTGGRGRSNGVEALFRVHRGERFHLMGSASYSRTLYAAADGVLRPGNFDFPVVANALGTVRLHWGVQLSLRDTFASGRPYTPFNVPLSDLQLRGIYDLTRINGVRGPDYNRVDFDFSRNFRLGRGLLTVQGGVENALDRQNFLGYSWLNSCPLSWPMCQITNGAPEERLNQMPIFPSAMARYTF